MPEHGDREGTRASYVHGVSDTPRMGVTVGELLSRAVARHSDAAALIVPYQDLRSSYAELDRQVDDVAAGLVALGLTPGARIGVWAPNMAEWVVLQFATARAGLILVNINPAYRLSQLEYALTQAGVSALVLVPGFTSSDYVSMLNELLPELASAAPGRLAAARVPGLRWVVTLGETAAPGTITFAALKAGATDAAWARVADLTMRLQFDDPVNIQFTSGTTGRPEAATLSHYNIVSNTWFAGVRMALHHGDRMCIPVPMYPCFGMVLGTLCCVAHGATMVFAAAGFDATATMDTVEADRCSALHGVPTMFIAELASPAELMKRIMGEMHMDQITIAYGMTETGPVGTQTSADDPVARRVETVGRVLPHTEIKIVDPMHRIVPRGTAGELLTRGYCVMPKYWNDPDRTAEAIDEARWIASGDVAVLDDEGYFRIVGRIKDMLIRGGGNIFPREIEDLLCSHPAIEQVEAIGVPDPKYGEEVCAWIKLRPGETATPKEIRAFCKGRIAHFKIPRYIRFVEEYPMTVTGKVRKFVMPEIMAKDLAAVAPE